MSEPIDLDALIERILRDITQTEVPDRNDLNRLVNTALKLRDENAALLARLDRAEEHLRSVEAKIESLEPFSHLVQFSEGSI